MQRVATDIPIGQGGFADDLAPRDALVAIPLPPGSEAPFVEAAGIRWVVGDSLTEARAQAGKVQGRRTTVEVRPPLPLPDLPDGGVRLATSWVEPAYLEPDASWCAPGGIAAITARERRRVRWEGVVARCRSSARARRSHRPHRAHRLFARRRRAARPQAPTDCCRRGVP